MKALFVVLAIASALLFTACAPMREAGKEVGKPIGGILSVPGGVAEGVNEGYIGKEEPNPYGR